MSETAYKPRRGYGSCRVIGEVEREHSMNGRSCTEPWDVLEFEESGDLAFHCDKCGVGHHGGAGFDELLALWEESNDE